MATEDEMIDQITENLRRDIAGDFTPGECMLYRERPARPGSEYCEECGPAEGECAMFCGNPVQPGQKYCEDCAAWMAEEEAKEERQKRLEETRAATRQRLDELAKQGCACACEAECRMDSTNWQAMPKTKARKQYEELRVACKRTQRWQAEAEQRRQERDRQEQERHEQQRREFDERRERLRRLGRIKPVPLLMYLREAVLRDRDDRCPKWLFLLAPDLVLQLQPRPGERRDDWYLFVGTVLQGEGIEKQHFSSRKARKGTGLLDLEFGVLPIRSTRRLANG